MTTITDELFDRFISNETTLEETLFVTEAIRKDPLLKERYITAQRFKAMMEARTRRDVLPMEKNAAKSKGNKCVIDCERYILEQRYKNYGKKTDVATVREEHAFFTGKGVKQYNIGLILQEYGFSVSRQYKCSLKRLQEALNGQDGKAGDSIIVVVNEEILTDKEGNAEPNHAVCVLSIDKDTVTLFNPSTGHLSDKYSLTRFVAAWKTSDNYAVFANFGGVIRYDPQPDVMLAGVELEESEEELIEPIAEVLHDGWAQKRFADGWVYGDHRDDDKKIHPDLVPYSDLPESEKDYDRYSARIVLTLLERLGVRMDRITDDDFHCPDCEKKITLDMCYCSECGRYLEPMDFVKKD